jgi:hypothetical protein
MFEIGIFCIILFAIGYWTTLFIMGRREDVLHGEFVEGEPELMPVAAGAPMPRAVAPPRLVMPVMPVPPKPVSVPPPAAVSAPAQVTPPGAVPAPAEVAVTVPPPAIAKTPASTDSLQSLLVSIKQELKNAAQI